MLATNSELAMTVGGGGFDWAIEQTVKCIKELVELARPDEARADDNGQMNFTAKKWAPPPIAITNKAGDSLDHLVEGSVDCVVMDPPYYDNVMYAE